MVHKHKIFMIMLMLYAIGMGTESQACMTTFVNDSACRVAIFNELDKVFICIPKNGKRRFGNHDKHALFVVYIQQPKARTEVWAPAYTCQQSTCGTNGNILLKFTDIQKNTGAADLFTIVKHKPHSSMVGELPMIQKKNCHSCRGN
jgi:hypothetical protein